MPKWSKKVTTYRIESHLRELMEARGLSISDVVFGTRLSDPTVRRWYNNQIKRIDPASVAKLRDFLECSTDELYTTIVEEDEE